MGIGEAKGMAALHVLLYSGMWQTSIDLTLKVAGRVVFMYIHTYVIQQNADGLRSSQDYDM